MWDKVVMFWGQLYRKMWKKREIVFSKNLDFNENVRNRKENPIGVMLHFQSFEMVG